MTAVTRRRTRIVIGFAAVASITAAMLVAGPGYDAERMRMYSGAVWLASNLAGEASLVDGATGEVRAHARVAEPGTVLSVAQHGGTAFVANHRTGELSRVDSATEQVSRAGADLPANGAPVLRTAPGIAYGVDVHSGTTVSFDPDTMRSSGERVRLAESLEPDSVVVDGRGRLWAIDAETGDLVWLVDGGRRSRPAGARNGRLTITEGRPVLVDPGRGTAELLHPGTGVVAGTVRPGVSAGDLVAVSGSADRSRVLITNSTRGELVVCAFDTRSCADPVQISAPGHELGTPVEVDDHAVVPDRSTGQATIVDLAGARVVAQRQLFDQPASFDLVVHDGIVFFNDPNSSKAGILDLAGKIRAVTKYTSAPAESDAKPDSRLQPEHVTKVVRHRQQQGLRPPGTTAHPGRTDPTPPDPSASIVVSPGHRGEVGDEFELTLQPAGSATTTWRFGDGTTGEGATVQHSWREPGTFTVEAVATFATGKKSRSETTVTVDPAGAPLLIDQLTVQRPKPVIGESVHFGADASGKPDRWAWTVTRSGDVAPEVTAQSAEFDHRFTTPGRYTVSLTIVRGIRTTTSTRQFTVARGAVQGWGRNWYGVLNIPPSAANGVIAIDAGGTHGLALKADGSVITWGSNAFGLQQVPQEASSGVVAIAAGDAHSLALKADGSVIGWGGEHGQGVVPPAAQRDVIAIAAGYFHSMALKKDGSVVAWPAGSRRTAVPPAARSGVIAISGGGQHSLALKADGSVIVWGPDDSPWESPVAQVPREAGAGVVAIASEHSGCLALTSGGSVIGWGEDAAGELSIPAAATHGVTAIDTYDMHAMAMKSDGTLLAWGLDENGQATVPAEYRNGVLNFAAGKLYSLVLV